MVVTTVRSVPAMAALVLVMLGAAAVRPARAELSAVLVASGFTRPVGFIQHPSNALVQLILEQGGRVRVIENGQIRATDFLDLTSEIASAGEQGLLGLAFAPDFATSRRVFVSFTNRAGHSVLARFTCPASDPLRADPSTRFDLVWPNGARIITQPFTNHNGGHIAFGPDGFLYFGLGDGGSGDDPMHLAQNPRSLLGKMLRLDVAVAASDPEGYDVPVTNPFLGRPDVLPEIWALGLRNPWRWSFDDPARGGTGALVIADVGQDAWEEVNYEPAGAGGRNYGWRNREGTLNNVMSLPPYFLPLTDPVWEITRSQAGNSITGGFVYRGNTLGSAFRGRYFFADFVEGRVWSIAFTVNPATHEATAGSPIEHTSSLGGAASSISSFGLDAYGELYIVNYGSGVIYRVGPVSSPAPGSCASADPFVAFGGGQCFAGTWLSRTRGNDMNGDHRPDLVFQNTTGLMHAWFMNGAAYGGDAALAPSQIGAGREIAGMNDFTGDGKPDLVVQHQTTGALAFFVMDGTTRTSEIPWPIAPNTPWRVAATGDFDGDSHADILWMNISTGHLYIWFMQPSGGQPGHSGPSGTFRGGFVVDPSQNPIVIGPSPWRVVGSGDVDGDGRSDVFWQNDATGDLAVWTMNGLEASLTVGLTPSRVNPEWRIRAVGDYNGDQHPDFIWRHSSTGGLYVWFMVGTQLAAPTWLSPAQVNPIWQIMGPK